MRKILVFSLIPFTIYDPDFPLDINTLPKAIQDPCAHLSAQAIPPSEAAEILTALFQTAYDVPNNLKPLAFQELASCGNLLGQSSAKESLSQSFGHYQLIPKPMRSAFQENPNLKKSWAWFSLAPEFHRAVKNIYEMATPRSLIGTRHDFSFGRLPVHKPTTINAESSSRLKKSFDRLRTKKQTPALSAQLKPNEGVEITASSPKNTNFCYEGRLCVFDDEIVEGKLKAPDGEYISARLAPDLNCNQALRDKLDTDIEPTAEQKSQAWDEHLACLDPCLTPEERAALLDDKCDKECKSKTVREDRYEYDASGVKQCRPYVKPEPKKQTSYTFGIRNLKFEAPRREEQQKPAAQKEIPDHIWREIQNNPKLKALNQLAFETGGETIPLTRGDNLYAKLEAALKLNPTKDFYQILFLIDASGSMQDDVEELRSQIPALIGHAIKQLKEKGQVTFGVHYYVDDTSQTPDHLDSEGNLKKRQEKSWNLFGSDNQSEAKDAQKGLGKAIEHIETIAGGWEYHFDEAMKVMKEEP